MVKNKRSLEHIDVVDVVHKSANQANSRQCAMLLASHLTIQSTLLNRMVKDCIDAKDTQALQSINYPKHFSPALQQAAGNAVEAQEFYVIQELLPWMEGVTSGYDKQQRLDEKLISSLEILHQRYNETNAEYIRNMLIELVKHVDGSKACSVELLLRARQAGDDWLVTPLLTRLSQNLHLLSQQQRNQLFHSQDFGTHMQTLMALENEPSEQFKQYVACGAGILWENCGNENIISQSLKPGKEKFFESILHSQILNFLGEKKDKLFTALIQQQLDLLPKINNAKIYNDIQSFYKRLEHYDTKFNYGKGQQMTLLDIADSQQNIRLAQVVFSNINAIKKANPNSILEFISMLKDFKTPSKFYNCLLDSLKQACSGENKLLTKLLSTLLEQYQNSNEFKLDYSFVTKSYMKLIQIKAGTSLADDMVKTIKLTQDVDLTEILLKSQKASRDLLIGLANHLINIAEYSENTKKF